MCLPPQVAWLAVAQGRAAWLVFLAATGRLPLHSIPPWSLTGMLAAAPNGPAASRLHMHYSATYNATYLYNPQSLTQTRAEQACRDNGGHLVAWQSQVEQADVEQHFISTFALNMPHTQAYWIGLQTNSSRMWGYVDRNLAPLNISMGYTRWVSAANSSSGSNNCAMAQWLPGRLLSGVPVTWGWMDAQCSRSLPSICKMLRE